VKYRVYIDANAHHMDTSQRTIHGEYDSAGEAVEAAKEVVRGRLQEAHRPGMKATELLQHFALRAETPFILPQDADTGFDPLAYARNCAQQLCWREQLR
jgi:hypothetical protein